LIISKKQSCLAEVFEDDGDVHVDDDEEAHDEVGDEVDDRQAALAAVAVRSVLGRRGVTAGRFVVHQPGQHAVPAGRRRDLEQRDHALEERLEVEQVVDAVRVLDVHEEGHAEDGEDEHDEEEQEADVDERRHRDGQREQQRPDALGRLDESQDATNAENTNDAQQRRRHEVLLYDIRQKQAYKNTQKLRVRNGTIRYDTVDYRALKS